MLNAFRSNFGLGTYSTPNFQELVAKNHLQSHARASLCLKVIQHTFQKYAGHDTWYHYIGVQHDPVTRQPVYTSSGLPLASDVPVVADVEGTYSGEGELCFMARIHIAGIYESKNCGQAIKIICEI